MKIRGRLVEKINLRDSDNHYLFVIQGEYGLFKAVTNERKFIDKLLYEDNADKSWELSVSQVVIRENGETKVKEYLDNVIIVENFKVKKVEQHKVEDEIKKVDQVDAEDNEIIDKTLVIDKVQPTETKKISDDEILTEFQNKNNNLKDITIDDTEEDDDDLDEVTDNYVSFSESHQNKDNDKEEKNTEVDLSEINKKEVPIDQNKDNDKEEKTDTTNSADEDDFDDDDDGTEIPADWW